MKILMLHDCAGVGLKLRKELIERGFDVDLYFFGLNRDPYLDYGDCWVPKVGRDVVWFIFKKLMKDYDIIHTYNTRFPNHPLPYDYVLAKLRHRRIVVHFHGSDLRIYHDKPSVKFLLSNKTLLVSTPDLLQYCPDRAIWLHNPVCPDVFYPTPQEPHDSIRILHSSTDPEIKGTIYLEKAVDELRRRGYNIELLIVGKYNPVPASVMPKLYAWADIVVNELLLPLHSLVGIEAMLCERPVVSSYKISRRISNPPIVDVCPSTLVETLERLIQSPKLRRELGEQGRKWALENHDPKRVTDELVKIYGNA